MSVCPIIKDGTTAAYILHFPTFWIIVAKNMIFLKHYIFSTWLQSRFAPFVFPDYERDKKQHVYIFVEFAHEKNH